MRIPGKLKPMDRLAPGLYLVTVMDIRYARSDSNQILLQKGTANPLAYEITFRTETGGKWVEWFYLSEASRWRLEKFCQAIDLDLTGEATDISMILGIKKLYIIVQRQFVLDVNGDLYKQNGVDPVYTDVLDNNFIKYFRGGIPPVLRGNPAIPDGAFRKDIPFTDSQYARRVS